MFSPTTKLGTNQIINNKVLKKHVILLWISVRSKVGAKRLAMQKVSQDQSTGLFTISLDCVSPMFYFFSSLGWCMGLKASGGWKSVAHKDVQEWWGCHGGKYWWIDASLILFNVCTFILYTDRRKQKNPITFQK